MSMTREQAVQEILDAVTELDRWSVPKAVEEALSILAPEPRTEPPGVGFTDHNFGETKEGMPVHTAIMHVDNYEVEVAYEPMTEILKHLGIKWEEL